MATSRINLLGMSREQLEAYFSSIGEKPFRARQVMKWIYARGVDDFDAMTDLAKGLRSRLRDTAEVRPPEIGAIQESADGTIKWFLKTDADQGVETVFIPEPNRGTLCISSQVGCAMDCEFCATAQQGFNRNLSAAEIAGQVYLARNTLEARDDGRRTVTNVVLMGMGEPLSNYNNVVPVLKLLIDDFGFELSRRRVTLSTSGIVPHIDKLALECNVALAVSLHAPDDELRNRLVPINRRHPIDKLLAACWRYARAMNNRQITFEYVMLDGVNDSAHHARRLAKLLRDRPAKVNLIPFNPFAGTGFRRSTEKAIEQFRQILLDRDVLATIRRPRGEDIDAACGQLAGKVLDRTRVRLGKKLVTLAVNP